MEGKATENSQVFSGSRGLPLDDTVTDTVRGVKKLPALAQSDGQLPKSSAVTVQCDQTPWTHTHKAQCLSSQAKN